MKDSVCLLCQFPLWLFNVVACGFAICGYGYPWIDSKVKSFELRLELGGSDLVYSILTALTSHARVPRGLQIGERDGRWS